MRICQCWDDGNLDDIRLSDLLRKHGATASFNLNPGLMLAERYHGWDYQGTKPVWKLAQGEALEIYQGFDIANHSMSHPVLTTVSDEQLAQEIVEARDQLEQWFQRPVPGFVYPYGSYDARVMAAVRAAGHTYARTCGTAPDVMAITDRMEQPSSSFHLAEDFWQVFERVRAVDGVFYFWGHSYEFVTEDDWAAFDAKLARINSTPGVIWSRLAEVFAPKP